jgi:hypothetical protein
MVARVIEAVSGVLTALFGVSALAVGWLAPLATACTTGSDGQMNCTRVSVVQLVGLQRLTLPIEVFGLLLLAIALFSVWHSVTRSMLAILVLWPCTLLLCLNTILAADTYGVLVVPADLLGLVACVAGLAWHVQSPSTVPA